MEIKDMPKLKSPFVRELIDGQYVVTPQIEEGYEWVFEDDTVLAVEKLDGTNVSIIIENGKITRIFNRTAEVPFFNKGKSFIIQAILESFDRGYCNLTDGQYFGEVIGPKLGGNPYKLDNHLWIPFDTYGRNHLMYKSWGKYPKDYDTISNWFKDDLFSLFIRRTTHEIEPPEGVVFVRPIDGLMAKLRRDMYPWFEGKSHHRKKVKNG